MKITTHLFHKILSVIFLIQVVSIVYPSLVRSESLPSNNKGKVMIFEYHKIDHPESRWTRTPENFRKDLQRFYEKGYQLIRMDDFLENRIRVGVAVGRGGGTLPIFHVSGIWEVSLYFSIFP